MTQNRKTYRPTHAVYVVEGEGDKAFWIKIGAAWPHDDGEGFRITLTALPVNGQITLRKVKAKTHEEARA